jgi:hypothetical protein
VRAGVARAEAGATEAGCVTGGGLSAGGRAAPAGWLIRMPATAPAMATATAPDRSAMDFLKLISSMRAYSMSRMEDGPAARSAAPVMPRCGRGGARRSCEPGLLPSNEPGIAPDNTPQDADMHPINRTRPSRLLPLPAPIRDTVTLNITLGNHLLLSVCPV